MTDRKQCEFFLLRYVADAVKNEFVNIGVVLTGKDGLAEFRMTRDWSRVRCMDPAADTEMLEAMGTELRQGLMANGEVRATLLKKLQDSFSNLLQLSETKACLTEDFAAELDLLAQQYLESSRQEKTGRDVGARIRIFGQMRDAFTAVGVWDHPAMWKRIPVGELAADGDPLKIDCGYRPNGVVRLFHAVALDSDVSAAKVLAYSYPALREGILKKENAHAELTAIIEDDLDRSPEQVRFAIRTLESNAIKIASVAQLTAIAQQARVELKL
jgi:hypothetical protein